MDVPYFLPHETHFPPPHEKVPKNHSTLDTKKGYGVKSTKVPYES